LDCIVQKGHFWYFGKIWWCKTELWRCM